MSLHSDGSNMTDFVDYSFNKVHDDGPYYSWETPTMAQVFVRDLYARILEVPESTAPEMLFSMFLVVTAWPKLLNSSRNQGVDILLLAAVRGSTAARGIVDSVVTYHDLTLQEEVEAHRFDWRRTAAMSGSILAQRALACYDPSLLHDCVKHFRDRGGYATLYGTFDPMRQTRNTSSGTSYSLLHELATYGTAAALETHLEEEEGIFNLDALTDEGETSVYLACARGSWEILQIHLSHGADCRTHCTQWDITCLHWAFAFDENRQAEAVSCLVAAGADVNALVGDATPFPHYPFILPPGTALHWAVATRSHTVIESLLQNGVDITLRDGCDMYVFDDRIRILDKFGGPNMEAYSIPKGHVKGLSALDYAAMTQDPFIFDIIFRLGLPIDINDVDEEGLSVLHRLSTDPNRRTRTGNAFCDKIFRGAPSDTSKDLIHIIKVIVDIGGDLELLTTPSAMVSEHNDSELTLPCYTPLMMAALGTSVELVEALLQAGARVDAVNDKGQTALMCISEDREAAAKIIPVLIAHGANVNHVDKSDATPIFLAAGPRSISTVDLLLSKGADIDSRIPYKDDEHGQGRGIFGMLPRQDDPFNDEADVTIKGMLEKYVFACPDIAKKRLVIDKGDIDGRTLLHQFARSGMPHCVQALLSHGAPVNAPDYIYRRGHEEGKDVKLSWFETPLDTAFVAREQKIQEMQRESVHTLEENEDILMKIDRVIVILQKAGGSCTRHEIKSEPFVFDQSKFGKRGFVRALRESGSDGVATAT
jgi:ankyrin repeat protein